MQAWDGLSQRMQVLSVEELEKMGVELE